MALFRAGALPKPRHAARPAITLQKRGIFLPYTKGRAVRATSQSRTLTVAALFVWALLGLGTASAQEPSRIKTSARSASSSPATGLLVGLGLLGLGA